jgi:hypothetical protein
MPCLTHVYGSIHVVGVSLAPLHLIRKMVYVAATTGVVTAVKLEPSVDAVWKYTCAAPVFGSLAIDLSTGLGTNVFTPGTDPNTYVCTYLFKQFTILQEQFSTYVSPYVMSSRC